MQSMDRSVAMSDEMMALQKSIDRKIDDMKVWYDEQIRQKDWKIEQLENRIERLE